MEISLNNFPYYLSERTKHHLVASYFLHLNRKMQIAGPGLPHADTRVLLSGPEGSELYQYLLAKTLSLHFGGKLLVFDCRLNLSVLAAYGLYPSTDCFKFHTVLPQLYTMNQSRVFSIGDSVIYIGLRSIDSFPDIAACVPPFGCRGRVLSVNKILNEVAVRFELPFRNGNNLEGVHEPYQAYLCFGSDICIDVDDGIAPIFTPNEGFCAEDRLILLMLHTESYLMGNLEWTQGMSIMLSRLPENVFVIGSHVQRDCIEQKERLSDIQEFRMQQFLRDFPDKINIEMPEDKNQLHLLKSQLIRDRLRLRAGANVTSLKCVLSERDIECEGIETIQVTDLELTNEDANKVVKWGLGRQIMTHQGYHNSNLKLAISRESIIYGLDNLRAVQKNNSRAYQAVVEGSQSQGIPTDAFEMRIAGDVLQTAIDVKFDNIIGLDYVKSSLKEVVVFPISRPKPVHKGKLRKLCRGVLVYGPPGTGKTMLVKAVAAEAGANLLNVSASIISSKWSTDSQNFVQALSSFARKMAPCIIFIDEADTLFSKRRAEPDPFGNIRNDFMLFLDRLCSKEAERIIVIAATNRPFDLDEEFIKKMACRIMVSLPDNASRLEILKLILEKEDLSEDVDLRAIVEWTAGFSGKDLENLFSYARYPPVSEAISNNKLTAWEAEEEKTPVRPFNMGDFKHGFEKTKDAAKKGTDSLQDILKWNNLSGCGRGRVYLQYGFSKKD